MDYYPELRDEQNDKEPLNTKKDNLGKNGGIVEGVIYQIKTAIYMISSPRKTGMELKQKANLTWALIPLSFLCVVQCAQFAQYFSKINLKPAMIVLYFGFGCAEIIVRVFVTALMVYAIAALFRNSAGLKANIICVSYAFLFPYFFNTTLITPENQYYLIGPAIIIWYFIVPCAIAGCNGVGYFRALSFYSFALLLAPALGVISWYYTMAFYPNELFRGSSTSGLFSAQVQLGLTLVLFISSLIVGFTHTRSIRFLAVGIASIALVANIAHSTAGSYYKKLRSNPYIVANDYCAFGETAYFLKNNDNGAKVFAYNMQTGKRTSLKRFDKRFSKIVADKQGELFFVEPGLETIDVYKYDAPEKPLFVINTKELGCRLKINLVGNNFTFAENGDFIFGCNDCGIYRYSRKGKKVSEFVAEPCRRLKESRKECSDKDDFNMLAIAVDENDDYYAAYSEGIIQKIDSSGNLIYDLENNREYDILNIDYSDGRLYALIEYDEGRSRNTMLTEYDSSGESDVVMDFYFGFDDPDETKTEYYYFRAGGNGYMVVEAHNDLSLFYSDFVFIHGNVGMVAWLNESSLLGKASLLYYMVDYHIREYNVSTFEKVKGTIKKLFI
ncbi:MAG: hypothetical protein BWY28_01699 [bacterium ADurb.Bin236]|nr:MAG: hypothetical protein BWY28_01699 [bacterium ADurb.Bin236]